jgi:hypothetical protein
MNRATGSPNRNEKGQTLNSPELYIADDRKDQDLNPFS